MIKRFALHVLVCYIVFVNEFPSRYTILIRTLPSSIISKDINLKNIFFCRLYVFGCKITQKIPPEQ